MPCVYCGLLVKGLPWRGTLIHLLPTLCEYRIDYNINYDALNQHTSTINNVRNNTIQCLLFSVSNKTLPWIMALFNFSTELPASTHLDCSPTSVKLS